MRLRYCLRLAVRARYWRYRADYWRRKARESEVLLKAETLRNRGREDELVSRIATSRGVYGIEPRTQPAYRPPRPTRQSLPDISQLKPEELEEYSMYLRSAAENGIPINQATNDFWAMMRMRQQNVSDEEM